MSITPYALRRLDDWYCARVTQAFSTRLEKRVLRDIERADKEAAEFILSTPAVRTLSREGAIEESRTYFRRQSHSRAQRAEQLQELRQLLAPGVYNEYIAPLEERAHLLDNFLERVGSAPPDELDNDALTTHFTKSFGSASHFADLCDSYLAATLVPLDLLGDDLPISGLRIYRTISPALRRIVHATFSDIRAHET